MTEKIFIETNKADWLKLEKLIASDNRNPEELHDLFVKVSGDLSYAQTYYKRRSIRWYLNSLVNSVFDSMRTKPKINLYNSLLRFYSTSLPNVIIKHRYSFIIAFLVFSISLLIGVYSSITDTEFPKLIMGREYIAMTEENINKGDPMAVYKSGTRYGSFLGITVNNILVALNTYVFGIFAAIGSLFIMIYNGIMVGAFQTFFYNKGILGTSMLSIWIHGTIEISSIIIAGAASLILGKSLLFPKTFSRMQSLRSGAVESVYVILSTIPLFMVAGFFEGYVTPQTDLPSIVKLMVIIASGIFIIGIYVIRPFLHYRNGLYNEHEVSLKFGNNNLSEKFIENSVLKNSLIFLSEKLGSIFKYIIIPNSILIILSFYFLIKMRASHFDFDQFEEFTLDHKSGGMLYSMLQFITSIYFYGALMRIIRNETLSFGLILQTIKEHFVGFAFLSIIDVTLGFYSTWYIVMLIYFLYPWAVSIIYMNETQDGEVSNFSRLGSSIKEAFNLWGHMLLTIVILTLFIIPFLSLLDLSIKEFGGTFLSWHNLFDDARLKNLYIESIFDQIFSLAFSVLFFIILKFRYSQVLNKKYSIDIREKIEHFGKNASLS